jgi:hypothetical protein
MAQTGITKEQAQKAFAAVHKYAMHWTSHRVTCPRLQAEVHGHAALPACNCGYFDATEQLEKELSNIRTGGGNGKR